MKGILFIILFLIFGCKTSFAARKTEEKDVITIKIKSKFIDVKRSNQIVYFSGNVVLERQDVSILADEMTVYYFEDRIRDKRSKTNNFLQDGFLEKGLDQKMEDDNSPEGFMQEIGNINDNALKSKKLDNTDGKRNISQAQNIQRIEVKNNVKIFSDEFLATGKFGVYDPKKNNFILENDVVFNNGTSVAKGQKFVYDLNTKKGNLIGKVSSNSQIKKDDDHRVTVIIDDNDIKKTKSK